MELLEALARCPAFILGHSQPAFTATRERLLPLRRQVAPFVPKLGEQLLLVG
jgi:hypothetical protein